MLPRDTITYSLHIQQGGAGNYIITYNNPTTILGFAFNQSAVASNSILYCGENEIFNNFAKEMPYIETNYVCYDTLKITKTGQDEAFIIVDYVLRDRILIFDKNEYQNSSTTMGLTYGEILTNFFLFLIIVGLVFGFILKKTLRKDNVGTGKL